MAMHARESDNQKRVFSSLSYPSRYGYHISRNADAADTDDDANIVRNCESVLHSALYDFQVHLG